MKNRLNKIVVSTLLVASSLMAEQSAGLYSFENIHSFVGIEGGYNSLDVEGNNGTDPALLVKHDLYHGGLKVGAQSDNYRIYLNANYYDGADSFDYMTTYGIGIQYMFNFSNAMNAFIGLNTGMANARFVVATETTSRTISDPYMGGEAGVNVHLGEDIDLEIGARILSMDISNTKNDITYIFDNMITGYASINFKYEID